MRLVPVLTLLHGVAAFWFVSGVIGRGIVLRAAAQARDVRAVDALVRVASRFEAMVRIPSIVVLGFGLLSAWRGGWPILGFLRGGSVNWVLASLVLSLTLVPLIVWVFLPRGRIFEEALRSALAEGRVTPALTAAFRDPVVAAGHVWEVIVIALLIVLMVTKPF